MANPKWGPKKIVENLKGRCMFTEIMVKKYLSFYFYDRDNDAMCLKSTDLLVGHNKCLQKAELIEQI